MSWSTADSLNEALAVLRCPVTGEELHWEGRRLVTQSGVHSYRITDSGIPVMAEQFCSPEARIQQQHYDRVAGKYVTNLSYPHTREYMAFLDRAVLETVDGFDIGRTAEICCGSGEAFQLLGKRVGSGVGVDVSLSMLEIAQRRHAESDIVFVQGDATALPLVADGFDSVFMLGGIHHVNNRLALFREIFRVLKPGGRFIFREPVSDFLLWRWIRAIVYRLSPALDHQTEHPLRYCETVPLLTTTGLRLTQWRTEGFLGFCLFMNSDVLVFNRLFRFVPGIRAITSLMSRVDALITRIPGLTRAGLQVIGCAEKPKDLFI